MKIKWLVADVTAVGPPDRAEHAVLVVILAGRFFCQFRPHLLGGIRHSKIGHPKNQVFKNSFFWLFLGAKFPNEERSSSAVWLVLVLAGKGPFLQKPANFGQNRSKLPILDSF